MPSTEGRQREWRQEIGRKRRRALITKPKNASGMKHSAREAPTPGACRGCATFQKAAGAPTSTRLIAAGAVRTATTVLPGWGSVKPLHRAEAIRQDAPRRRPDDRYSATSQDEHRRLTASGARERSATRVLATNAIRTLTAVQRAA